jgi:hypothetical protein
VVITREVASTREQKLWQAVRSRRGTDVQLLLVESLQFGHDSAVRLYMQGGFQLSHDCNLSWHRRAEQQSVFWDLAGGIRPYECRPFQGISDGSFMAIVCDVCNDVGFAQLSNLLADLDSLWSNDGGR